MSVRRPLALLFALVSFLVVSVAAPLHAQPHSPSIVRSVEGRVRRPAATGGDSTGMAGAARAMVTLHRVGKDTAGPIDSVRTDANGHYQLRYTPFGATDAVYFASVTWGGIAYFTAPLRAVNARGDDAEITVFDTTSRAFPLSIKGRHFIVGRADSTNMRAVIEVFELSNDSLQTLISVEGAKPSATWGVDIPQAAQDVRVTQGEIAPEAFGYATGRVSIFAPIAPGLKQVAFSYKMPVSSFPVRVLAERGAVVLEVLLEEDVGTVSGASITAVDPVTIEGRKFRRFLAQDVKPGASFIVELPASRTFGRDAYGAGLIIAILLVVLMLVYRVVQRRAKQATVTATASSVLRAPNAPRAANAPLHERLAQEIAALDAIFEKQENPSDSVRAAYHERRDELKAALTEALASVRTAG